jgi:hypothetical protein
LCFLGSRGDAASVVIVEPVGNLLLADFLDFHSFRVEAFLLELVLVGLFLLLFVSVQEPVH